MLIKPSNKFRYRSSGKGESTLSFLVFIHSARATLADSWAKKRCWLYIDYHSSRRKNGALCRDENPIRGAVIWFDKRRGCTEELDKVGGGGGNRNWMRGRDTGEPLHTSSVSSNEHWSALALLCANVRSYNGEIDGKGPMDTQGHCSMNFATTLR